MRSADQKLALTPRQCQSEQICAGSESYAVPTPIPNTEAKVDFFLSQYGILMLNYYDPR